MCFNCIFIFIVQLSHSPNRDDHSVVSCSQQERREPSSLNSARSGVQQAARAYSLIWSGLFACRGVVGGRVGSGFDKFLRGFPELDGTCEHSSRLPHSRLGDRKSAASPIHGNTWHCAASHTLLIVWLSHNPKRDDEVRGYLRSRQERRVPCSLISARSGVYLTTRACSLFWFGGDGSGGLWVGGLARDLTNFCMASLSSMAPGKTLRGFPHSRLDQRIARYLPLAERPGIVWHSHSR